MLRGPVVWMRAENGYRSFPVMSPSSLIRAAASSSDRSRCCTTPIWGCDLRAATTEARDAAFLRRSKTRGDASVYPTWRRHLTDTTAHRGVGLPCWLRYPQDERACRAGPSSPALSIIRNGPEDFKGRKLGVLVSDGGRMRGCSRSYRRLPQQKAR
jgi:hypothetical protein